jgi:hypothetical protein
MSPVSMLLVMYWPNPGQENTVSISTAPSSSPP